MKKAYYQPNLISNLTNSQLKLKFHEIGYRLNREYLFPTTRDLTFVGSIIKEFFSVAGIEDPILAIYPSYYIKTPVGLKTIERETHPFYQVFNIGIGERFYDPTVERFRNLFEITINREKLKGFIAAFIVEDVSLIDTNNLDIYYEALFITAFKEVLAEFSTKKLFYSRYDIYKHTEQSINSFTSNPFYYNFESQYNFYDRKYETVFSSGSTLPESIIPNLYACNSYVYFDEPEKIRKVVSLDGRVRITEESLLNEKYYFDYATAVENITDPTELSTISKVRNYVLDPVNSNISTVPLISENFPYSVKIKVSNYYSDAFETFITNNNLNTYTVNNSHYLFNNEISKPSTITVNSSSFYVLENEYLLVPAEDGAYTGGDGRKYNVVTTNIQSTQSINNVDYTTLFNFDSSSGGFAVYNYDDYKFYSEENRQSLIGLTRPATIFTYLSLNSFEKTISTFAHDYLNVINLVKLNEYNLCFQVEKSISGSVVNNFSFSRNEDTEFSIDDTQVVYGKTYDYRFYGINYVNSFSYNFNEVVIGLSGSLSSATYEPPESATSATRESLLGSLSTIAADLPTTSTTLATPRNPLNPLGTESLNLTDEPEPSRRFGEVSPGIRRSILELDIDKSSGSRRRRSAPTDRGDTRSRKPFNYGTVRYGSTTVELSYPPTGGTREDGRYPESDVEYEERDIIRPGDRLNEGLINPPLTRGESDGGTGPRSFGGTYQPDLPPLIFPTIPTVTKEPPIISLTQPTFVKDNPPPAIIGIIDFYTDAKIYKNHLFDKSFAVHDNPPAPVTVQVYPLIKRPNNLLFWINEACFKFLDEPEIIYPSDIEYFKKMRIVQNLGTKKILFECAKDMKRVDVFRTTTPPRRYSDFADNLYRSVPFEESTSTEYLDTLQFNTKYYYTFRGVDVHDNISNPTSVYQIEIINNDGAIYSVVRTYDMRETQIEHTFNKSFKKYISINPSAIFTTIEKNDDGKIIIGNNNTGLWGEKFKIRVKSKESGKCFDINLTFNKKTLNSIDGTSVIDDPPPVPSSDPSTSTESATTTRPFPSAALTPVLPTPTTGSVRSTRPFGDAPATVYDPFTSTTTGRPFDGVLLTEDRRLR